MNDRQRVESEYRARMSRAALDLRNQVTACWGQSTAMLNRVNDAIDGSDVGDSPPDEEEMGRLWDEVAELTARANRVESRWHALNNAAQVWTVIAQRPHYFADLYATRGDQG